jgi:hypothetical protein
VAKKKSLSEEKFAKLNLNLTASEKLELDCRLQDADNERMLRVSLRAPTGKPRHDISQYEGGDVAPDETAGAYKLQQKYEKDEFTQQWAAECKASMTPEKYQGYLDEVKTKSGIGKNKFDGLNYTERYAVRIVVGYKIDKSYDKMPLGRRQKINEDAIPLYDAVLKIRSENRVPTDGQIRSQFIEDLNAARMAGIELGTDREVDAELSPEEEEKLAEERRSRLKRFKEF